jgi:hypothetical protein
LGAALTTGAKRPVREATTHTIVKYDKIRILELFLMRFPS